MTHVIIANPKTKSGMISMLPRQTIYPDTAAPSAIDAITSTHDSIVWRRAQEGPRAIETSAWSYPALPRRPLGALAALRPHSRCRFTTSAFSFAASSTVQNQQVVLDEPDGALRSVPWRAVLLTSGFADDLPFGRRISYALFSSVCFAFARSRRCLSPAKRSGCQTFDRSRYAARISLSEA